MNKIAVKKYYYFIIMLIISLLACVIYPQNSAALIDFTYKGLINFIVIITPIFIIVGLLDIWVKKDDMIKIMGGKSGVKGTIVAFLLGLITAVPLYALLPIAALMLKKRSKIFNVLIFICTSVSMRIPLLLFESSSFGLKHTLIRFFLNLIAVFTISYITSICLTKKNVDSIYKSSDDLR